MPSSITSGAIQQGVPAKVVRERYASVPSFPHAARSMLKLRSIWTVTPRSARITCPVVSIRMLAACRGE